MAQRRLVKVLVPLALVAVFGVMFWRSVRGARSTPYTLSPGTQRAWALTVPSGPATEPTSPVLLLVPPPGLSRELFDQVFKRSMESMRAPEAAGIPLVLAGELQHAGAAGLPPEALFEMARAAGLDGSTPAVRCMVHQRLPEPDTRKQAYIALFESAPFAAFRASLAARLGPTFDVHALVPALYVGLVEATLDRFLPTPPDPQKDCVAPIEVAAAP
jgi:hypothetical protein